MKLSDILIVILLVSAIFTGSYALINNLADSETGYNVTIDDSYLTQFNKTTELSKEINESYSELLALPSYSSSNFFIISLVPEALGLIKELVTLPFVSAKEILNGFTTVFAIPQELVSVIIAIICVILLFAFLTLILRFTA
tara:strand:+ start:9225 stop:9647 length:423 start_codon:yes stop_codon:yes gene_type:complete